MKRILQKTLLAIACLLCSFAASAYSFEVDGIYYDIISETDKIVEVTYGGYYSEYIGSVVIPETVTCNGTTYSVTSIGESAFEGSYELTSVTIPESVTSIGYCAFRYCDGLTSITIPESVTSIGDYAFYQCYNLRKVINCSFFTLKYHSNEYGYVAYYAEFIINAPNGYIEGDYVWYEYKGTNILAAYWGNATELSLPDNYGENYRIGDYAFSGCDGLTSITIPNSVTLIGDYTFYGCTGLTSVTIPNSVTSIGNSAFNGCSGLTSITIPNSVTSIGDYAFKNCTGLTSITIPNSVSSIGDYTFYGCTGLTSVTIPNSVTSIGDYAFNGCTGLTSITIPNSVTSIGEWAFGRCTGLTEIAIPNSVTSIGNSAFNGCDVLTSITIPNSVTSIGDYAFGYCDGLTSVTIPESVTSIGYAAFYECTGLTSVTIGNSVTSIGDYAFYKCSGLTSIIIPNSVTSIGSYAFEGCENLKKVINFSNFTLDYYSKNYGWVAYYANLIINAPNGYIEGDYVWYENEGTNILAAYLGNATELSLPDNYGENYRIGVSAFKGCTGLTSVTIPKGVTSIGSRAFEDCTGLKKILWNAQNCQSAPFGDIASQITSFEFGWDVEDIPSRLCKGMTELSKVAIPNTIRTIGDNTFDGCSGLQSVTLGNKLRSIGDNAFDGCNRIKDVYAYPTQPPTIYANTFTYYVNDNATLHTIIGCKKDYEEASYWNYFYNIKQDLSAGIEGVKAKEAFSVAVVGGTLAIAGAADDAVVNIYNTNGALLHNTTVAGAADIALPNGIYLVQVNGVTQKVVL